MSARNEGRSVRCIFCADSPEECQALCGALSPLQRSRGGIFWVHEECARWASGVTALPPNPDEVEEVTYVTPDELRAMLSAAALRWSPWFVGILERGGSELVDAIVAFQDGVEEATAAAAVLPRWLALPLILWPAARRRRRLEKRIAAALEGGDGPPLARPPCPGPKNGSAAGCTERLVASVLPVSTGR